jgi:ubiquinone/menaquinone biosynthesis C-methylase UbiE
MAAQSQLDSVKSMYDERSEQYDDNHVHVNQARDYCLWANLKAGDRLLDLACGTGLVALGAKQLVGDSGHVVGVDISEGMLIVARRKAAADGLAIPFYNHDISDLSELFPDGSDRFDVITCASALILLPDPLRAVKHWTSLLNPGGRIITDVQTKDANVTMNIFSEIAPQVGESVPWHSHLWQSQHALETLMTDAGLQVVSAFESEPYATTRYDVAQAEQLFDKAVIKSMFKNFDRPEIRETARRLFVHRFADIAGPEGCINEETRYWVIVASTA